MQALFSSRVLPRLARWLPWSGPAEAAPIVLGHRRIYVLPTTAGLAFAGALLVMLLASINYQLNLGFALVFLLAGVAVTSMVHAVRNLLHLSIQPGRAEPVFAGETARFSLLVENPRAERRPALQLRALDAQTGFEVPAEQTTTVVLPCATRRRGRLAIGRVVLETTYPLGLVRAWSVLQPATACIVYPTPEKPAPPLPDGEAREAGKRAARTGDDDFAGLRPHQVADSPRHVAWKVLARGGPLLTKQFAGMGGGQLVLDWNALPAGMGTEDRLRRLAAWVLAASASGRPFRLCLPHRSTPAGTGPSHVRACLELLALHGCGEGDHA